MKNLLLLSIFVLSGLVCFGQNNGEIPILVHKSHAGLLSELMNTTEDNLLSHELCDEKLFLKVQPLVIERIRNIGISYEVLNHIEIGNGDGNDLFGDDLRAAVPQLTNLYYTSNLYVGEEITFTLEGKNNGTATSESGYITMSFPNFNDVNSFGGSSGWTETKKYPTGTQISTCYNTTPNASYVLVDGYKVSWSAGETRNIWAKVTPTSTGTLTIYSKMSIGSARHPSGGCQGPDQQYWPVFTNNFTITSQGCNSNYQWPSQTYTPSSNWNYINGIHAGEYSQFYVTSGTQYHWSLCPQHCGDASYDSELTLRRASNNAFIDYADDICGNDARISWTANFTGNVKVVVTKYNCQSQSTSTRLAYKSGSLQNASLSVSPSNRSVGNTSGSTTFSISSNVNWSLSGWPSWITSVSPSSGSGNATVTVNYSANTGSQRIATINGKIAPINGGTAECLNMNFTVTQAAGLTYTVSGYAKSTLNNFDVIKDATVTIDGKSAQTNSQGYYEIAGVTQGTHQISISNSAFNWEQTSYTINVNSNVTRNFFGNCKASAEVTYVVPSTFTPGVPFDIVVNIKNMNYAVSGVKAYLDVSFPGVTSGSTGIQLISQSGFDGNPEFYPAGTTITKVNMTNGTWYTGPANYLLVSAERSSAIHNNQTWTYTLRVTPPSVSNYTIHIKGNIADRRDPNSGSTGQQGLWEKVVNIPQLQTHTVSGYSKSTLNNFDVIKDATVTIDGKSAQTDSQGYYEIAGVTQGTHQISISNSAFNWEQTSYTINVNSNVTRNFFGNCKASAEVTYVVPSTFTPGVPFDIVVNIKNMNYAVSGVKAYLDVSFPGVTSGSTGIQLISQSGFDGNPEFYPAGTTITKVNMTNGTWYTGPADYLLVSAERSSTIHHNQTWTYTLRVTPPSVSNYTIHIKGSIADRRDPSSGSTGQQGFWEKVVNIPQLQTYTVSGYAKSTLNNFDVIKDATVTIDGKSAQTDSQGYYEIAGVTQGTHQISISNSAFNWEQTSYTINVNSNVTRNFFGNCKASAEVTYVVPSTFTPGVPFDIVVNIKNMNYAVSGVKAYLDVSFPGVTSGSTGIQLISQSGFDGNPEFYPAGSTITKVNMTNGTWFTGPANYLLVSAERSSTIHHNQTWTYTLRVTPPSVSNYTIHIKGSIADRRDPSSGSTGQQGFWEKVVNIPQLQTHTVSGYAKSTLNNFDVIKDATVTIDGKSAQTNSQGYYEIAGVIQGTHQISISNSAFNWEQTSYTINVNSNVTRNFFGNCKASAVVTYNVPSTFTPGVPFDIVVNIKNMNYAVEGITAYLDVSFPNITSGSEGVQLISQSGFDENPQFYPAGSIIYKVDMVSGTFYTGPADYLLVSAARSNTLYFNQTWTYTLRIIPPAISDFTVHIKGNIADRRDPSSGSTGQQGFWEFVEILNDNTHPPIEIPILMYHNIDNIAHSQYWINVNDFSQQMEYLDAYGYNPVWLSQIINYCDNGIPLPSKPVVLTFDDGYLNFYTKAYPILQSRGFKATSGLITDFVGTNAANRQTNTWELDPFELSLNNPHLIWPEVHQMAQSGLISFQSHSKTHPVLPNLNQSQLNTEIISSKNVITGQMGSCDFFSYPYGAVNNNVENTVISAGYHAALDIDRGYGLFNTATSNRFRMERLYIPSYMTLNQFAQKIDPGFQFPNLEILSVQFYDQNNNLKTTFTPGETIVTKVQFKNNGPATTTTISLNLRSDNTGNTPPEYDSHLQVPSEDHTVYITTGQQMTIQYEWIIPTGSQTGQWQYAVGFHCQHYLLWFGGSYWQEGFEVIEVGDIPGWWGQGTVINELGYQFDGDTYFLISYLNNSYYSVHRKMNEVDTELVFDPAIIEAVIGYYMLSNTNFNWDYEFNKIDEVINNWQEISTDYASFSQNISLDEYTDRAKRRKLSNDIFNGGTLLYGAALFVTGTATLLTGGAAAPALIAVIGGAAMAGGSIASHHENRNKYNNELIALDNYFIHERLYYNLALEYLNSPGREYLPHETKEQLIQEYFNMNIENIGNAFLAVGIMNEIAGAYIDYSKAGLSAKTAASAANIAAAIGAEIVMDAIDSHAASELNDILYKKALYDHYEILSILSQRLSQSYSVLQSSNSSPMNSINFAIASIPMASIYFDLNQMSISCNKRIQDLYDENGLLIDALISQFDMIPYQNECLLTTSNANEQRIKVISYYNELNTFTQQVINSYSYFSNIYNNQLSITFENTDNIFGQFIAGTNKNVSLIFKNKDNAQVEITSVNLEANFNTSFSGLSFPSVVSANSAFSLDFSVDLSLVDYESISIGNNRISIVFSYLTNGIVKEQTISFDPILSVPVTLSVVPEEKILYNQNEEVNFFYEVSAKIPAIITINVEKPDGETHFVGSFAVNIGDTFGSLPWLIPPGFRTGPNAIKVNINASNYNYGLVLSTIFSVFPELSGNLSNFNMDQISIISSETDFEIAQRIVEAIPSTEILYIEGLTGGDLLEAMQNDNLILIGGDQANFLVEYLVQNSIIPSGLWQNPGDAHVIVLDDPFFPIAPPGNKAIVVAGYDLEDTFMAGLKLLHEWENPPQQVSTPYFYPPAPYSFNEPFVVSIGCNTLGSVIHYTTDGSTPNQSSSSGNSVLIDETTLLKAIAFKEGWTPSIVKEGLYSFSPATYSISGHITISGAGISGVNVSLTGLQNIDAITNQSGYYVFNNVPAGGPYHLLPSHNSYSFFPESHLISDLNSNLTVNFEAQSESYITVNPQYLNFHSVPVDQCEILNYNLTGVNLSENVIISAPEGFEISLEEGSGYASSLGVPHNNGVINTTIYVKFCPVSQQMYSGSITHDSPNVVSKSIYVTGFGTLIPKFLSVVPMNLEFGDVPISDCSTLNYQLTGSGLTDEVIIIAPSGFQVSTNETSGFEDILTLPHTNGSVNQTIYVRFCPDEVGDYSGEITNVSAGAETKVVEVEGEGWWCIADCVSMYSACEGDPPVYLDYLCTPGLMDDPIIIEFGLQQGLNNITEEYIITFSGPGVFDIDGVYYFDPLIGVGTYIIQYNIIEITTGCTASASFPMTVEPYPVVTCPDDFEVSIDTPPFNVTGVSPTGGEFYGPIGINGLFDPSIAGIGTHTITYVYPFIPYYIQPIPPPPPMCYSSCDFYISVTPPPTPGIPIVTPHSMEENLMSNTSSAQILAISNPVGNESINWTAIINESTGILSSGTTMPLSFSKPFAVTNHDHNNETSDSTILVQGSSSRATWDILQSFSLNSGAQVGIATDGNHIYSSTWNVAGKFSKYELDGNWIEDFYISGVGAIRDLAYDGTYFYGGAAGFLIYELDLAAQSLISTISSPIIVRHISYDPQNDAFWCGSWNSLQLVSRSGNTLITGPGLNFVYGSAYDNYTEGGPYLWFFAQLPTEGCGTADDRVQIQQFNIASNLLTGFVYCANDIPGYIPGVQGTPRAAGGAFASDLLIPGKFVLMVNVQQTPNLIGVYELAQTSDWLSLDKYEGVLSGGESDQIIVTFNSTGLEQGVYTAQIVITTTHPDLPLTNIPVTLTVFGNLPHVLELENIVIPSEQHDCYSALNTITVAGNGNTFVMQAGSQASFVAGNNIVFKPGFHAQPGSTAHAYITTNGEYCNDDGIGTVLCVENLNIQDGNNQCLEAKQIIMLGGNGGSFVVENGGQARIIAGNKIQLMPGVHLHQGSEVHGYISTNGYYCDDPTLTLENITILANQSDCFEAIETITVGGNGSSFIVKPGGEAFIVAGQNVIFREGTQVEPGGYLHAWISTNGIMCNQTNYLLVVEDDSKILEQEVFSIEDKSRLFKVYPNPTTGRFTLEMLEFDTSKPIQVMIYSMLGKSILQTELFGYRLYEFDLSSQSKGLYIVRVISGEEMDVEKVIVN
jgi:peptidoglycan/xylan/chitin deacetylase (PgdA/CDA1 family)